MKKYLEKLNAFKKEFLEDLNQKRESSTKRLELVEFELKKEINERLDDFYKKAELVKKALSKKVKIEHKKHFVSTWTAFLSLTLRHLLSAPFIYSMIFPALILDIFLEIYHRTCFPLYKIPLVKRSDYFFFDRRHLAYLNWIEKLNCFYCSYFNNLIAYTREIAGRTERYWCPIKHSKRLQSAHSHYGDFVDYLDGEAYRKRLEELRNFEKIKLEEKEKEVKI